MNKVLSEKQLAAAPELDREQQVDVILNDKELAIQLDPTGKIVTPWVIRNWRLRSGLPHFLVGKRVFYRLKSVIAWVDEREKSTNKAAPDAKYGTLREVK